MMLMNRTVNAPTRYSWVAVAEQDEGLVKGVMLGIRTHELWIPIGVFDSEHVVIGDHVREAEPLGGLCPVTYRDGVAADLRGGENGSDLHVESPSRGESWLGVHTTSGRSALGSCAAMG